MLLKWVLLGSSLACSTAVAFDTSNLGQGSLHLEDIMELIDQSPALKREVAQALARIKKKEEDIICMGMRFAGNWVEIGGGRVAPYACDFERQWLLVRATVRITDAKGREFKVESAAARRAAAEIIETAPTWTWSDTEPKLPR